MPSVLKRNPFRGCHRHRTVSHCRLQSCHSVGAKERTTEPSLYASVGCCVPGRNRHQGGLFKLGALEASSRLDLGSIRSGEKGSLEALRNLVEKLLGLSYPLLATSDWSQIPWKSNRVRQLRDEVVDNRFDRFELFLVDQEDISYPLVGSRHRTGYYKLLRSLIIDPIDYLLISLLLSVLLGVLVRSFSMALL
jgi:hypothetical protein